MKKALTILLILIFSISVGVQAAYVPGNLSDYDSKVISIIDYYSVGDVDYTNAIVNANAALKSSGGGTLVFPAGDYKIKPGRIKIPSGVKWLGQGAARIYTQETSLYNIAISTEVGSRNIVIENLIFDQRGDAAMIPNVAVSLGAFMIHINSSDNVYINGNTFYTYGVCAVLAQSDYTKQINVVTVSNNSFYFQRKVDVFYDVSVINIDGRSVYVENNHIEGIDVSGFKYSKPRSAIEVHMPNGIVSGNTTKNTEVGILHLGWPTLWNTYESLYRGNLVISNNTISKAIIGIEAWSATTLPNIVTRNLSIKGNNINLHLDNGNFPAQGISFTDGSTYSSRFENIVIEGNTIKMTVDPAITDPVLRMNYLITGSNTGAMSMNIKSTIDNMEIYNNTIVNFPYSFLNLHRRNNSGETNVHNNIRVHDNIVSDSSYSYTYMNQYDYSINVGNTSNVAIYNNAISNPTKKLVGQLNRLANVTGFEYTNNTFDNEAMDITPVPPTEPEEPVVTEPIDGTRAYVDVIGTWANSKQIYVTNMSQCLVGDVIITPNNEKATIGRVSSNYIFLLNDVTSWYGGKAIILDNSGIAPEQTPEVTEPEQTPEVTEPEQTPEVTEPEQMPEVTEPIVETKTNVDVIDTRLNDNAAVGPVTPTEPEVSTSTQFSNDAETYNPMSFHDVEKGAWHYQAVSFIAARKITTGTGNGLYSPEAKLTRGEFIVMMLRAYGIVPDSNPTDNFSDAGDAYYTGYLAAAKRLGISTGIGNNLYAPGKYITRQEMFTLMYNVLEINGKLPEGNSGRKLSDFTDAGQIDSWAKNATASLVGFGLVSGYNGSLNPKGITTRAEMAQVLYNLLGN